MQVAVDAHVKIMLLTVHELVVLVLFHVANITDVHQALATASNKAFF